MKVLRNSPCLGRESLLWRGILDKNVIGSYRKVTASNLPVYCLTVLRIYAVMSYWVMLYCNGNSVMSYSVTSYRNQNSIVSYPNVNNLYAVFSYSVS